MDGRTRPAGEHHRGLNRRAALLLPLLLAACGGNDEDFDQVFPPLRYNYLPPIELKVASISIEQRFVPAGVPPDVSNLDPVQPVDALKAMANDRLMAFGTENTAVFEIQNASLTKQGDVITGIFQVTLSIRDNAGNRLGFSTAQVTSQHTGPVGNIRKTLYDLTKAMMADMNVEFEYQIRRNLKPWLTSPTAPDTPVQQTPLDQSGNPVPPQNNPPLGANQSAAPPPPGQTGAAQPGAQPGTPAPIQLTPPAPSTSPPSSAGESIAPAPGSPSYPGGYLAPPATPQ